MSLADRIRQLAARPCGVGIHDLKPDYLPRDVHSAIHTLEKRRGELHKAKAPGYRTAWFLTAEARDAYMRSPTKTRPFNRQLTAEDKAFRRAHYVNAGWAPDAPVHRPAHVKVQVCPSAPPRFQEHTFCFVHNGLGAA